MKNEHKKKQGIEEKPLLLDFLKHNFILLYSIYDKSIL